MQIIQKLFYYTHSAWNNVTKFLRSKYYLFRCYLQWSIGSVASPNNIYHVPVEYLMTDYSPSKMRQQIMDDSSISWSRRATPPIGGGDWDKNRFDLGNDPRFNAIKSHHQDGQSLMQTEYPDFIRSRYMDKVESVEGQVTEFEELYESIRASGYDDAHPIKVAIARDGQYLIKNGRHRLAIANALDIEKVPVKVIFRHKNWQDLRHQFYVQKKYGNDLSPELEEFKQHPDFSDLID